MMPPNDGLRCSGLLEGNRCAHGFAASAACWPANLARAEHGELPMCLDEELCGEWFDSNGGAPWPRAEDLALLVSSQERGEP